MHKISNAKRLLLALGLGLGLSLNYAAAGPNCRYLLEMCEAPGEYAHLYCAQFQRYCGPIP